MSAAAFRPTIGQAITLATVLEATAPKPGNVYRGADFEDLTYLDLVTSAVVVGPIIEQIIGQRGVAAGCLGAALLAAVKATRQSVATNTNLGTLLLLVPLAMVPSDEPLATGIARALSALGPEDARDTYEAIRVAAPGGLGRVEEADVHSAPPADLLYAMQLGADRDLVARQYSNRFADVLERAAPWIEEAHRSGLLLSDAIVHAHLRLMSELGDSLIARKCGPQIAQEASDRAAHVLSAGEAGSESYRWAMSDLDFWLRSDGHRRNPGTTADLIAAGLFVLLRDGIIEWPLRFYPPSDGPTPE